MARFDGESGQTTSEYVGLVFLVALVAASFAAVNLGPGIAQAVEAALCRAVGGECSDAASAAGPELPLVDPALTAAERQLLLHPDPQFADLELESFTASELAWLKVNDPEAFQVALEVRSWSEQRALLDEAMDADLNTFHAMKDSETHDPRMDYSDDGCSVPILGSDADIFGFEAACERHDFGYRNSKRLGLFDGYKRTVDAVFGRDLYDTCEDVIVFARKQCKTMAAAYYSAVRVAGGHCDPPGSVERVPGPCAPEHG